MPNKNWIAFGRALSLIQWWFSGSVLIVRMGIISIPNPYCIIGTMIKVFGIDKNIICAVPKTPSGRLLQGFYYLVMQGFTVGTPIFSSQFS